MNPSEETIKWSFYQAYDVLTSVKQLPTPGTKPLR